MQKKPPRKRLKARPRARYRRRPFALDLRHRILPVLFYKTHVSQDVAGAVFGVGQASVSRSIGLTEPLPKQCLPIPEKIYEGAGSISSVEELFPGMEYMTDASEQQIGRPRRRDMERSHYSGKAGMHTAKVQYTIGIRGDIAHKTPLWPGCVNGISICQMRHPTFWSGGMDGERLRHYGPRIPGCAARRCRYGCGTFHRVRAAG